MEKTRRKLVAKKVASLRERKKKISVDGNYFDRIQDAIDLAEPGGDHPYRKGGLQNKPDNRQKPNFERNWA